MNAARDLVLNQLSSGQWLFEQFLKDFSDADAKYQPFPGANHANWILVHLAISEDSIIAKITGGKKAMSENLHTTYGGGSECRADDGMTKAEAWKIFTQQRARTLAFLQSYDEANYAKPAPEGMPPLFKTVGDTIGLLGGHPYWHFGQLSVNRRMLKKSFALMG